jgi:predicted ester cyclase
MSDDRAAAHAFLSAILRVPETDLAGFARSMLTPDTVWDVAFPVGRLEGIDAVLENLVLPLRRALHHVHRRDELFIGGSNRRSYGGEWVASVTHYVGNHTGALFGLAPSDRLAFLRSGEFYRLQGGKIAEAKLIVDFLDLMRQAGRFPLPKMLGTEMLFPGPATHDGVLPTDRTNGEASLDIVEGMLADLHLFDPATFHSEAQTGDDGYWHEDMLWYGPAGIGSNFRWEGFVKDHRESFLLAFPDRKGGNHYCRIGDGDFAAISGWPSMTMTHKGDYLGIEATGKALTLRVMDFYRCAGGKIMENWVLLDYLDMFDQMGVDLIERSSAIG